MILILNILPNSASTVGTSIVISDHKIHLNKNDTEAHFVWKHIQQVGGHCVWNLIFCTDTDSVANVKLLVCDVTERKVHEYDR